MPKVSVLVPIYNIEKYIGDCLDSILAQTFSDIEVICVNDGSTDDSLAVLERYAEKDSRVIVVSKPNGGLPSARNAGLDRATGDYVAFVDGDDTVKPEMIEVLYRNATSKKVDIVVCGAELSPITPRPSYWLQQCLSPKPRFYKKGGKELLFYEPSARPFLWRLLVRRALIEENGLRLNEAITLGEDTAFQARLYPLADGILLIPDKLYIYKWYRPDSIMSRVYRDTEYKLTRHVDLIEHLADEWIRLGVMKSSCREFIGWCADLMFNDYISASLETRVALAPRIIACFEKAGYHKHYREIPEYIRDMFRYIESTAGQTAVAPRISEIVWFRYSDERFEESVRRIVRDAGEDTEFLFVNIGVKDYWVLDKNLRNDKRVRIANLEFDGVSSVYNKMITLSKGRFLHFRMQEDYYPAGQSIAGAVERMEETGADVYVSPGAIRDRVNGVSFASHPFDETENLAGMVFRRSYLEDKEICFGKYGNLAPKIFAVDALLGGGKILTADRPLVSVTGNDNFEGPQDYLVFSATLDGVRYLQKRSLELGDEQMHLYAYRVFSGWQMSRLFDAVNVDEYEPEGYEFTYDMPDIFRRMTDVVNGFDLSVLEKYIDPRDLTLPYYYALFAQKLRDSTIRRVGFIPPRTDAKLRQDLSLGETDPAGAETSGKPSDPAD